MSDRMRTQPPRGIRMLIALLACLGTLLLALVAMGVAGTGPFSTKWPPIHPAYRDGPPECAPSAPGCPN